MFGRAWVPLGLALISALTFAPELNAQEAAPAMEFATQSSGGTVSLEVTPSWTDRGLLVTLAANTHSVDLETIDLVSAVRLWVGEVAHAAIDVGSLGGHHARAELVFQLDERPTAFRIDIRGVPDVPLRSLVWPAEPSHS